jgi:hypothetical protein
MAIMMGPFMDFGTGFFAGGLAVSIVWGLFWFVIGLVGRSRRACGWSIVGKGLAGGFVSCSLLISLLWCRGESGYDGVWFASGALGMPGLLLVLSLRPMPDGKTAGMHLREGVRSLVEDLLGGHRRCDGCHSRGDHEACR